MNAREEILSLLNISRENCHRYEEYAELVGQCMEQAIADVLMHVADYGKGTDTSVHRWWLREHGRRLLPDPTASDFEHRARSNQAECRAGMEEEAHDRTEGMDTWR